MQAQAVTPPSAPKLDTRSMIAAGLCILALFSDGLGVLFALAGIFMLRGSLFNTQAKWLLGAVALGPKIAFVVVRRLYAPTGISFPIESWNLATSPGLWALSIALASLGLYLVIESRRDTQGTDGTVQTRDGKNVVIAIVGLLMIGGAIVALLGLTDDFHRIDDAGQGRWTLRHAARGRVATFTAAEVASVDASEKYVRKTGWESTVRIALTNGQGFAVTTRTSGVVDEVRKFATTASLAGKAHIVQRDGRLWTSGAAGFLPKDCVGTYDAVDMKTETRSTYAFWLDGDRLTGTETVTDRLGRHVRVLKDIKLSDSGAVEFDPGSYLEASQKEKGGTMAFSLRWSSQGESGRFVQGGFECGGLKYRKI